MDFYDKQNEHNVYLKPIDDSHVHRVDLMELLADVQSPLTILELGAGGGQTAAVATYRGHQVTVVEFCHSSAENCRKYNIFKVVEDNFYTVNLEDSFDIIVYWDGFGIGTDEEQQFLLQRMAKWLRPGGCVIVEVFLPWFWYVLDGFSKKTGQVVSSFSFDAKECRFTNEITDENVSVVQSLRCYSPADLKLLLDQTPFRLLDMHSGWAYDFETDIYNYEASFAGSYSFVAKLCI